VSEQYVIRSLSIVKKIFVFNFDHYVIKCLWSLVTFIVVHVYFLAWFVFAEICYGETLLLMQ